MKSGYLAQLTPMTLEIIHRIEHTLKKPKAKSKKFKHKKGRRPKKPAARDPRDETLRRSAQQAREICPRWKEEESKLEYRRDVLPVVNFLFAALDHELSKPVVSEIQFKWETQLLEGIDDILSGGENHLDLAFARTRLKCCQVLCAITQQQHDVYALGVLLRGALTEHCDRVDERCQHLQFLDKLAAYGMAWMSSRDWKIEEREKIGEMTDAIASKMMSVYDSLPSTLQETDGNIADIRGAVVTRVIDVILFLAKNHPDSHSIKMVKPLLEQLRLLLGKHVSASPSELNCLHVLNAVESFLKTFSTGANEELNSLLIHLVEVFVPETMGSLVVDRRQSFLVEYKPGKEHKHQQQPPTLNVADHDDSAGKPGVKPLFPVGRKISDDLAEDNKNNKDLLRELQETEAEIKVRQDTVQRRHQQLIQQLEKYEKGKMKFDQTQKAQDFEVKELTEQNEWLKTQIADAEHQGSLLQQAQRELAEKLQQSKTEGEQRIAEQQRQTDRWGQQVRERQMSLSSVLSENRRLRTQMAESQPLVQSLEQELKQMQKELTAAQKQIAQQTMEIKCDQTAASKKLESLQREIARWRALQPVTTVTPWPRTR